MRVGDFISRQIYAQIYVLVYKIYKINFEVLIEGESG